MAQQYPFAGGNGAGHTSASATTPTSLSGNRAQLTLYFGSGADGAATAQAQHLQLSGAPQQMALYFGSASDGWSAATVPQALTLNGDQLTLTLFRGGLADGGATETSAVQALSGTIPDLTLYKGGAADGWATKQLPQELALDGKRHTPTLFMGAAADGWAQAEVQDQTLNGEPLRLVMFNGGAQDGFATDLMPERGLDGLAYTPTLFFGGNADGWAHAEAKNKTLGGEQQPLVMFMGAASDGWAGYTSESQSLGGNVERLILFRGGRGQGYAMAVFTPEVPLPVELMQFGGARAPGGKVQLHWVTASEVNNAGFEVWRQDSGGSWGKIGYSAGAGTSYSRTAYTFEDINFNPFTTYYRLRQLDHDGTATLSKTIAVTGMQGSKKATAWPIPVQHHLKVQAAVPETPATLLLFAADGRLLLQQSFTHKTQLYFSHLPSGLYLLHVQQPGVAPTLIKVIKGE